MRTELTFGVIGSESELEIRDKLLKQRVAARAREDRAFSGRHAHSRRGLGPMGFLRKKNESPSGVFGIRDWVYYDAVSFAAGAAFATTTFFAVPQGQGGKLFNTTNLQGQGGQLPAGETLTIKSIRLYIANTTIGPDLQNIISNVSVHFKVRQVPIFQCTPEFLPPGCGGVILSGGNLGATLPTGTAQFQSSTNGMPTQGSVYNFSVPYLLESLENFQIILSPDVAFSMAAATAVDPLGLGTTIKCYLEGVRNAILGG
jgi:hypothetical protein